MSTLQRNFVLGLILVTGLCAPMAAKPQVLTTLHSFAPSDGSDPSTALTKGENNSFYGTTRTGGQGGAGTIFKLSPNDSSFTTWSLVVLHAFGLPSSPNDGAGSVTAPILAQDGNLYGTAYMGGANGTGAVYRITSAGVFTKLYDFTSLGTNGYKHGQNGDGANPGSNLIEAADGSGTFYGSTQIGGMYGYGTLFRFNPSDTNSPLTTLYSFTGKSDGAKPFAGLIQASDHNLYGSTQMRGMYGYGTLFRFNPSDTSSPFTTLYSFTGGLDGANPARGVIEDQSSPLNFYGTTMMGGTTTIGDKTSAGVVFKLDSTGNLHVLHTFPRLKKNGTNSDGASPHGGLVQDANNALWGTTASGGINGTGTLYRVTPDGATFTRVALDPFNSNVSGAYPHCTPIQDTAGNFYITTTAGGANAAGTVYQFTSNGAGVQPIHAFGMPDDGANPQAALVEGSDGFFYGTALGGGVNDTGAIFKIGSDGAENILHSFTATVLTPDGETNADGAKPAGALVYDNQKQLLYGTASAGGSMALGTLFSVSLNGSQTTLHDFAGAANNDGATPEAGLIVGSQGRLIGTTVAGAHGIGANGFGTCFTLNARTLTYLASFAGGADGDGPQAALVQDVAGNSYGTCKLGGVAGYGTVFTISNTGMRTTLHSFSSTDGALPVAALILKADYQGQKALYGTTQSGGANGNGTVFKITTDGAFTLLHSFSGSDGADPQASLIQGKDRNFYGTTQLGGAYGYGTLFQLTPGGNLTTLHSFTSEGEGAQPYAPLIQGNDGKFYGTTSYGGVGDQGTVFSLDPQTPSLTGLKPASVKAGSPAIKQLQVIGAGFLETSTVNWNGTPLATTYVSGTRLNAAVPANLLAQPAKAAVTVVNSTTGSSNAKLFTIR